MNQKSCPRRRVTPNPMANPIGNRHRADLTLPAGGARRAKISRRIEAPPSRLAQDLGHCA